MKKGILIVIISLVSCGFTYSQTVEPPTEADEFGWLRWAVIVLLGVVVTGSGTFFAFLKHSYESRLEDKNAEIQRLVDRTLQLEKDHQTELNRMSTKIDKLTSDKDLLHKDMQEKIIPALTSASDLIRTFLTNANNSNG